MSGEGHLELLIFFLITGFLTNWIAWSRGFYSSFPPEKARRIQLTIKNLGICFLLYFLISLAVVPLLSLLIIKRPIQPSSTALAYLQLFGSLLILFSLWRYARSCFNDSLQSILRDKQREELQSHLYHFSLGSLCWFLSYPVVASVGQILDYVTTFFFGAATYEQLAVRHLKALMGHPEALIATLILIILVAPLLEEFLFRGILQTYLKQYMHPKWAIVLAALTFAFFHMAKSQGFGNITVVGSLFTFALFLGYIYERQGALSAPIGLHMAFNGFSALRILFFTGEPL